MSRYRCPSCGYEYDEQRGHAREGFPPGTPWSAVPDDWPCPDCGVRDKVDFEALDAGAAAHDTGARDAAAHGVQALDADVQAPDAKARE